jgi:hypothetical protein
MTTHTKTITGKEAIKILQCKPINLINYMRDGLTAFHKGGARVYDLDSPDDGPGWAEHLQATRRHAINEMRMARGGESATVPEFPDGWRGMSFTADETLEEVKGLYFRLDDIDAIREHLENTPEPVEKESNFQQARRLVQWAKEDGLAADLGGHEALWTHISADGVRGEKIKKAKGYSFEYFEKRIARPVLGEGFYKKGPK